MGVLTDPVILAQYTTALSFWNYNGYIWWKQEPREFVERELGCTTKRLGQLMHEHVQTGGDIIQKPETREDWLEWRFHYDLYVTVGKREVYLETCLCDDDPKDCTVYVVSAHDP